jgi:hypothetical protein
MSYTASHHNIFRKANIRRIILLVAVFFLLTMFSMQAQAQAFGYETSGIGEGWIIELRGGTGVILSEIPEKYLDRLNNVNIPQGTLGLASSLSIKKMASPHFSVGYQLDYMRVRGVGQPAESTPGSSEKVDVLTQGMGHNFVLDFYFKKRTNEQKLNYSLSYKIGALSLNNKPLDEEDVIETDFLSNIAVITGWNAGVIYKFTESIRFTFNAELNRSSDTISDIYKPHKVFYQSTNTVNHYLFLTAGVNFQLNFKEKKTDVKQHLPFNPGKR